MAVVLSLILAGPAWADDAVPTTGAIVGTLTTQAGGPLTSTLLMAQGVNDSEGRWSSTYTDAAGMYALASLQPGTYVVSFRLAAVGVTQYIPQQLNSDAAEVIQVVAGQTAVLNDTVLPMGTVSGHLTEIDGSPALGAQVVVNSVSFPGFVRSGLVPADGTFHLTGVVIGDYKVLLTAQDASRHQYVPGTTDPAAAAVITVTAGADTTVYDQFIPTGSVRVSATDAVTGVPVTTPCAQLTGVGTGSNGPTCGAGSVTFDGVPEGTGYGISVTDDTWGLTYLWAKVTGITVVAGQTTVVTVTLTPRPAGSGDLPGDPG